MVNSFRQFVYSAIIPSLSLIVILWIHFNPLADTMLNRWDPSQPSVSREIDVQALQEAIHYHQTEPAFARRPLSTMLIKGLANAMSFDEGRAFVYINFLLLWLSGLLLFFLALQFKKSQSEALLSQVIFFFGFTILCAFFNTNYTYDEPLTYFFFFVCLMAFSKQHWTLFFLFFLLACISRETTYLFVLVLWPLFLQSQQSRILSKTSFVFLSGMMIVLIIHTLLLHQLNPTLFSGGFYTEMENRTSLWNFNFQNLVYKRETWVSIYLSLGFPVYLMIHAFGKKSSPSDNLHIALTSALIVLNTFVVLTSAYARESRLFALPLLLIYPLLGGLLSRKLSRLKNLSWRNLSITQLSFLLLQIALIPLSYHYFFNIYETTINLTSYSFNSEYAFILTCVMILFNILSMFQAEPDI